MEKGPTKKDIDEAYRLNELVNKKEITVGYASNADDKHTEEALTGLSGLDLKEYKELAQSVPNFENNPLFQFAFVRTLVSQILQKIDKESFDLEGDINVMKFAQEMQGDGQKDLDIEKILGSKNKADQYHSVVKLRKDLLALGTSQRILDWCEKQDPPIRITQSEMGDVKLFALRAFTRELYEKMSKTIQ